MRIPSVVVAVCLLVGSVQAQVTYERIRNASKEPHNWLTYSGAYDSHRHSALDQITTENAKDLQLQWVYQPDYILDRGYSATPLVVDGVMYTVQADEVVALDAATGRIFWSYRYESNPNSKYWLKVAKGVAILGDTVYWVAIDARLIAIDAKTGRERWNKLLADTEDGYSVTLAPLAVDDKILVGVGTNEWGKNCWLAAHDPETGKELWRFNTIPQPGEPGNETWGGDSWKHGGAPLWVTGAYDPELNLTYWGTGNPNPGWNTEPRPGDNLYSNSVIAVDVATGKLKWHFQFTPGDPFDHDAVQVPVLVDAEWEGKPRKLMLWANRNGFFYVLDRATGEFLMAKAFVKQNWNIGFDEKGRPMRAPGSQSSPEGTRIEPGTQGGTNWYSPSYSPRTGLIYVPTWDNYSSVSYSAPAKYVPGEKYAGRGGPPPGSRREVRVPAQVRKEDEGYGAIRALDPHTGEKQWEFKMPNYTEGGVLTTATDVLFGGGMDGTFVALDARRGDVLWRTNLGGTVGRSGPTTYAVNGRQYVAVPGGNALYAFALPGRLSVSRP
jgi:alcohol dehydrogenase (cytochrome c)